MEQNKVKMAAGYLPDYAMRDFEWLVDTTGSDPSAILAGLISEARKVHYDKSTAERQADALERIAAVLESARGMYGGVPFLRTSDSLGDDAPQMGD